MKDYQIMFTGDYAHPDFAKLIVNVVPKATLVKLDRVDTELDGLDAFDLIVVAQSRPGQFDTSLLEQLVEKNVTTPVVLLAGSWCEGELRSGSPPAGVQRVYWHQWEGRSEQFFNQLTKHQNTAWHLPKIATEVDRQLCSNQSWEIECVESIGISALTLENYEMIRDCLGNSQTIWLESKENAEPDGPLVSVVCVVANSLSEYTEARILRIIKRHPTASIVLCLNFPRPQELISANRLGVSQVVSKPFRLTDLRFAIQNAASKNAA